MCSELPSTEDSAADSFRLTWTLRLEIDSEPWSNTRLSCAGQRVRGFSSVNMALCLYLKYCACSFSEDFLSDIFFKLTLWSEYRI